MGYYDQVGACGPVGCAAPAGYGPGFAPAALGPWGGPGWGYGMLGGPGGYGQLDIIGRQQAGFDQMGYYPGLDIIGQAPPATAPAPAPAGETVMQKFNRLRATPGPLGVTYQNWALGAGAVGLIWYLNSRGTFDNMFGSPARRTSRDRNSARRRRR